jgi:hypothetical protein
MIASRYSLPAHQQFQQWLIAYRISQVFPKADEA